MTFHAVACGHTRLHAGRGLLKLEVGMPIYECNSACRCPPTCRNRVVQRGISKRIEVFKTKYKGWAVRALERIPVGYTPLHAATSVTCCPTHDRMLRHAAPYCGYRCHLPSGTAFL